MNELLFHAVNSLAGRSIVLDALIVFFTDSLGIVLVFALLLFASHAFYHGRRMDALRIVLTFASAGVAWCMSYVGKIVVAAPRPVVILPEVRELIAYGSRDAFPSGHTTFYIALGVALFLYNKKLGMVALSIALLIGLSRIAAGIHWPVDILAGMVLGSVASIAVHITIRSYEQRRQSR